MQALTQQPLSNKDAHIETRVELHLIADWLAYAMTI